MKLEPLKNPNYGATVVKVKHLVPLANRDKIVGMPMFGLQAIVGVDTKVGDVGVFFPPEVQLSDRYLYANNLYRHAEKNHDNTVTGYFEDNGRVRAIKFGGHRSDALFMPLSSLAFTKVKLEELKEGDEFDTLDGELICRKYYVKPPHESKLPNTPKSRVESIYIPEQFHITQFLKVVEALDPNLRCAVTQKLHGCNIRIANTIVNRKLTWFERVVKSLGVKVQTTEFANIYGSHHVIKDESIQQQHYYDSDVWTLEGKKLNGLIPHNYIVYGELVGYTPTGQELQKNYTYAAEANTCQLYVYRIAVVNDQGRVVDLSWAAVKEFCASVGLLTVPELINGVTIERLLETNSGVTLLDEMLDVKFKASGVEWMQNCVPLSPNSPCDEGVCIRIERIIPQIYKVKSPKFLQHESQMLDAGVVEEE